MDTPVGRKSRSPFDQYFKFVVLGDRGVGKSCLLLQFTDRKFRAQLKPTRFAQTHSRIINIDDKRTNLAMWETAGQEALRANTISFYRGAAAAILVYDITRRETFEHVITWLEEAKELALVNVTIFLLGNKCDLSDNRAVSYEEGKAFAKEHGLFFMESSAKTDYNVDEAFFRAATIVHRNIEDGVIDEDAKFGCMTSLLSEPIGSGDGSFQGGSCCLS